MKGLPLILLVEDNESHALLVRRAFAKAQIANPLQVVGDGDKAVEYLAGTGAYADRERYPLPVLMLLDLKLPRRSGLEVLAWLREQPGLCRLPVVVLTSSKESPDINRAYELGVNSYLVKQVSFEGLTEIAKNVGLYWLLVNEAPTLEE